jgi:hypothetical protein
VERTRAACAERLDAPPRVEDCDEQWCIAVGVRRINLSAGVQQELGDASRAVLRGEVQRREARAVAVVDIGTASNERSRRVDIVFIAV